MAGPSVVIQGILSSVANDVFVQQAINTGITGADTTAYRIKELVLDCPIFPNITTGTAIEVQLSRGTKAAIIPFSDTSLLTKFRRFIASATSGVGIYDPVNIYDPQGDIIIVESQIFLGLKTTGFAALATVGFKLILEEIKISSDQRISILASRLP